MLPHGALAICPSVVVLAEKTNSAARYRRKESTLFSEHLPSHVILWSLGKGLPGSSSRAVPTVGLQPQALHKTVLSKPVVMNPGCVPESQVKETWKFASAHLRIRI